MEILDRNVTVATAGGLPGLVSIPEEPVGTVLFAHGSDSSRLSPRNQAVARGLNRVGIATLLFDLLTSDEARDRRNVFDIELLADRVQGAVAWVITHDATRQLPVGLFGASTGAAAALVAAAELAGDVGAVVSRGGRPDLAGDHLWRVRAPTLLLVGSHDVQVLELNRQAMAKMTSEVELEIVAGATHLFSEPGALDEVTDLAGRWFITHLR